jgi:hypothetical protein
MPCLGGTRRARAAGISRITWPCSLTSPEDISAYPERQLGKRSIQERRSSVIDNDSVVACLPEQAGQLARGIWPSPLRADVHSLVITRSAPAQAYFRRLRAISS